MIPCSQKETVRRRLEIYTVQTRPLIDFYQSMSGSKFPAYHRVEGVEDIRVTI
jgi:adenylate kinase